MDESEQHLDSDGNRVNVGNFDSDGLNVNNYWDDHRNSNIGVSSALKMPPQQFALTNQLHYNIKNKVGV